ncbi:SDR family NAD(P)-dependent oxidoreductase, partial [Actinophytocola sp.]|uniref:SDR family NAD(P)-dependent oxidoreductase n=1 Tax=Actinophytocola sp. TaxID=1872138 RepID=UPI003899E768
AGIAGLIKTTLALHHRRIPASINVTTPNTAVDWADSPFAVSTETRPWETPEDTARRASVSSAGIGGTNAHVILEQAPQPDGVDRPAREQEVVLWSAAEEAAAHQLQTNLADHFDALPESGFADAAHTLRVGRTPRAVRGAVLATGARDAAQALRDPSRILHPDATAKHVVFAFPGQGAQRPRMLHDLYESEPVFRTGCDAGFEVLRSVVDHDLYSIWTAGDPAALAETSVAQPLLYVLEYALGHCMLRWGVRPHALVGHSLGELVAAGVAGVFDFETGLRVVAARAALAQQMPRGRMLAVNASMADLAPLVTDRVEVCAINGPRQVVLAGPTETMDAVQAELTERGLQSRPLRTSHAFHTEAMTEAAKELEALLSECELRPAEITLVSAASGAVLTAEQATSPGFWARQLVEPVNFDQAVSTVLADGPATFVEVGPGRTLGALLRGRSDVRAGGSRVLALTPREESGSAARALDEALAQLWVDGQPVRYWHELGDRGYRRVAVPGYPYQRRRYWIDPQPPPAAQPTGNGQVPTDTAPVVAPEPATVEEPGHTWAEAPFALGHLEWTADRVGRTPGVNVRVPRGTALLVAAGQADPGLRGAFGRAGYRCSTATVGMDLDPTDTASWATLLDRLTERGDPPTVVAYAAPLDLPPTVDLRTLGDQLATTVHSLYACAKAIASYQRQKHQPVTLVVLGRHMVDLTGAEPVNPAAATLPALLRSLALELPGITTVCLDVAPGTPADLIGAELGELRDPLIALRGTSRWSPRLRPLTAGGGDSRSRLRYRGTYLITGGSGGIGLVVANALADTGTCPRLVLMSRSGVAPGDRRTLDRIAEMEALGAEVMAIAGDVTDAESLRAVVCAAEARFGPIHGVVHSAGIAGGGLVERRARTDIDAVLAPKARGVLVLDDVFADRDELDFLLLFSSQAGLGGLYGSADYAAANAFLDGYARSCQGLERLTLSVQWPGWAEVGMAARSDVPLSMLTGAAADPSRPQESEHATLTRTFTPGEDWEFDEHVFTGRPVLPGTATLELVLMAALEGGQWPIELRDIVFLSPIVGDGPVEVRVLLTPIAGVHRFRVQTRAAGGRDSWQDCANGTVVPAAGGSGGDLTSIRARLAPAEHLGLANWIEFGERWEGVSDVRGDRSERMARIELPERFHEDFAAHPMHPAVLDGATGVLTDVIPGHEYAPFLYRRVVAFGPLTGDVTVHSRLSGDAARRPRPIDIDVYDTQTGDLLVRVEGFTVREVKQDAFSARPPQPRPVPTAAQTRPEPVRPGLLSPREGARVFIALLDATTPPVVVVDAAHDARLQVPGVAWTHEEPTPPRPRAEPVAPRVPVPPPADVIPSPVAAPAPVAGSADGARNGIDQTMTTLSTLWTATLGVTDVGPDDDFFDIGGNSLAAVALIAQIKEIFEVELSAGAMFELTTVRLMADELRKQRQ